MLLAAEMSERTVVCAGSTEVKEILFLRWPKGEGEGGVFEFCERGRALWGVRRCLCAWTSGSKPGMKR